MEAQQKYTGHIWVISNGRGEVVSTGQSELHAWVQLFRLTPSGKSNAFDLSRVIAVVGQLRAEGYTSEQVAAV
jgi:hypothetical protein